MLKKLVAFSIVSTNLGYTLFLFPLLSALYRDRVPFTASNLIAFTLVDTLGGVLLAMVSYLAIRVGKMSVTKSITLSVVLLWTAYWLTIVCAAGGLSNLHSNVAIVCLDGLAALITWATLTMLSKSLIEKKDRHHCS